MGDVSTFLCSDKRKIQSDLVLYMPGTALNNYPFFLEKVLRSIGKVGKCPGW